MVDAVACKGLTKRFDEVEAVVDLDLSVPRGSIYGLLGLNGAGKTTTVRMLTGVLPPTSGSASICGVDVVAAPDRVASRIGVTFGENWAPEPRWSPVRYLRHFGRLHGMGPERIQRQALQLLEVLRLEEYAERPIGELSGGNRRKVELARALLHGPEVLFLDEPTRELDIPAKRSVWSFLLQLSNETGVTIFLSSHDVQEIATLCDVIGILYEGRLTWEGTRELLASKDDRLVDVLADRLEGPAHGGAVLG